MGEKIDLDKITPPLDEKIIPKVNGFENKIMTDGADLTGEAPMAKHNLEILTRLGMSKEELQDHLGENTANPTAEKAHNEFFKDK